MTTTILAHRCRWVGAVHPISSLKQAQTVIETWLKQYNHIRPHQALNMRPPVPETALSD